MTVSGGGWKEGEGTPLQTVQILPQHLTNVIMAQAHLCLGTSGSLTGDGCCTPELRTQQLHDAQ